MAACLAMLSLAASASPAASSSVTIGQVAPVTPPVDCAGVDVDLTQPTVTSGTTYVVPPLPETNALMISSWSHNAAAGAGQMLTMKVFRKVADPATYEAVGHDGPNPLTASTLNTFTASVPVEPGDILGINSAVPAMTACSFSVPGETRLVRIGNLADGESGAFSPGGERRTNVSAVVSPSNLFTFGSTKLNKKKGTASITVSVPNPGELDLAKTKKVKGKEKTADTAGKEKLPIKPKGKAKKKLNKRGKAKVNAKVTFTPDGGESNTESTKIKLVKR